MEIYNIKNLSFTYPNQDKKALNEINLTVNEGEFVCIMGKSGCGKTTLLRLLKTALAPNGEICGSIYFMGNPISECDNYTEAQKIGFVMQNIEAQLVTDKVWHELSFGLENLGVPTGKIRARVAEMASFFGIGEWFYKDVCDLSGGQKQILNLASIMVMQPSVLILDEPTSQLDPISAMEFLKTLERINKELGTTIIITEHRTEEIFSICDRVIAMDNGMILADERKEKLPDKLSGTEFNKFLPTGARIYEKLSNEKNYPITVRDA
ncbi:MAG: ABC transporter ATP-binding protein, partial [Clostridia bacterium]|nr:ABC transporter ATP-binding protein [Clostridia bacterium]